MQTCELNEHCIYECPLHGIAHQVELRHDDSNTSCIIILRTRSTNLKERLSDDVDLQKLKQRYKCFDFELQDTSQCFEKKTAEAAEELTKPVSGRKYHTADSAAENFQRDGGASARHSMC